MTAAGTRSCPFCGRSMNSDATLCASCGRFGVDEAASAVAVTPTPSSIPLDRINAAVEGWEARSDLARRIKRGINLPAMMMSHRGRQVLGAALVGWGLALLTIWLGNDRFEAAGYGVAAIITGIAVLRSERPVGHKPASIVEPAPPSRGVVRLLGADTNLVVMQIASSAYMIERAYWLQVDQARWAAAAVVALAALLYTARVYLVPLSLAAVAIVYAIEVTAQMDSFAFRVQTNHDYPSLIVPLWPVLYGVAAVAMFPQLRLVRWSRWHVGEVHGDTEVRCFGSRVPLAFGSAALFAAAAATIVGLFWLPFWARVVFYWLT